MVGAMSILIRKVRCNSKEGRRQTVVSDDNMQEKVQQPSFAVHKTLYMVALMLFETHRDRCIEGIHVTRSPETPQAQK